MLRKRGLRAALGVSLLAFALVALGFALGRSGSPKPAVAHGHARAAPRAVGPPQTIVMVVFDELPLTSLMAPSGRIDASRYPAFAQLARDGTWYRGATAVHDSTALAVPAMLEGRYPRAGLGSDYASHRANLFTLLRGDYQLHVSEEATGLCPPSLCVPTPGTVESHLSGGKPGRFRKFVGGIRPTARPALWFKHVLLPHVPWEYYPSGRRYRRFAPEPIPGLNGPIGFDVPWLVKVSYERHLLQLGFADRLLGELLARLRRAGLYDDAMIVVVADHGIGFHVGLERRAVRPSNAEDIAPVPLIVKLPGARGGSIVDHHVETIDVLPTMLEAAGLPVPARVEGTSLLGPAAAELRRATVYHRVGIEQDTVGGHYVFDPWTLARRRDRAVLRKTALFGSGGGRDPAALYLIGPHPEIVGKPVSKLAVPGRAPGGGFVRIDQAGDLQDVDPSSSYVPGEITGAIEGGTPGGGRAVALALNGVIAATGRTFSLEGTPQTEDFEVIVPERAFRAGDNDPELFEIVSRDGGFVVLRPFGP